MDKSFTCWIPLFSSGFVVHLTEPYACFRHCHYCGCEQNLKCLLIHFYCLLALGSSWYREQRRTQPSGQFPGETHYCAFWTTLRWIFEQLSALKVWKREGEMEGKCRPRTVQRRLQSEVEGCDWWKEKHLFISFIHLNSCESRVLAAQPVCCDRAGSRAAFNHREATRSGGLILFWTE